MRHLFRYMALLATLAACTTDPQISGSESPAAYGQAPSTDHIETAIFQNILSQVPGYASSRSDRALSVCINWRWATPDRVSAMHPSWTYTSEGSDITIFRGRLMDNSLQMCNQSRTQAGTDCECVRVAIDDKSVLRVPDKVMQRLVDEGMPKTLIKCRLPDGIVLDVPALKCVEVGGTPK